MLKTILAYFRFKEVYREKRQGLVYRVMYDPRSSFYFVNRDFFFFVKHWHSQIFVTKDSAILALKNDRLI